MQNVEKNLKKKKCLTFFRRTVAKMGVSLEAKRNQTDKSKGAF